MTESLSPLKLQMNGDAILGKEFNSKGYLTKGKG